MRFADEIFRLITDRPDILIYYHQGRNPEGTPKVICMACSSKCNPKHYHFRGNFCQKCNRKAEKAASYAY